jgi:hypothetical protein
MAGPRSTPELSNAMPWRAREAAVSGIDSRSAHGVEELVDLSLQMAALCGERLR